jgi:hypothetical protein
MHTGFFYGFGKSPLGNLDIDGRIILKCILEKLADVCTELIWLRIGTSGSLL